MKNLIHVVAIAISLLTITFCDESIRLTEIKLDDDNVEGEVEIYYNDKWRPLAGRLWTNNTANVICKTIGFKEGAIEAKRNDLFGKSKQRFYYYIYEGLQCMGLEKNVKECLNWNKNVIELRTCSEGIAVAVCKR